MTRHEVIQALVESALAGMEPLAASATSGEMCSACFTLTARMVTVVLHMHPESATQMQEACQELLMRCVAPGKTN